MMMKRWMKDYKNWEQMKAENEDAGMIQKKFYLQKSWAIKKHQGTIHGQFIKGSGILAFSKSLFAEKVRRTVLSLQWDAQCNITIRKHENVEGD